MHIITYLDILWLIASGITANWIDCFFVLELQAHNSTNISNMLITFEREWLRLLESHFSLASWVSVAAWELWSVRFLGSRPPRTFRQRLYRLYKSWTRDPVRIHYGNTHLKLPRNYESPRDNTNCYHSHPHRCKNTIQHSADRRF